MQRIAPAFHVDLGDGPPRAAHEEQAVFLFAQFLTHPRDGVADLRLAGFLAALEVTQFQRAERGRHALAHRATVDFGQFHGRAADIADQAIRAGPAQQYALCRQAGLFATVYHPEADAGFAFDLVAEFGAVFGIADRRRGDGHQRPGAHPVAQQLEPLERFERANASFGVEAPGLGHARTKRAHDFLVVEIGRAARRTVKHHQPDRVGADIDHAHAAERAGRGFVEQGAAKRPAIFLRRIVGAVHLPLGSLRVFCMR